MKGLKTLVFCLLISTLSTTLLSQQLNTNYFIENNPLRQDYNPAFKPKSDYFISLPFIGNNALLVGNNSITLSDLVYSKNGQTILFNNPNGSIDKFYNTLQPNVIFQADMRSNLLAFGWRMKNDYISFSVEQRVDRVVEFPKTLFKLALYGTPSLSYNSFDLTKLQTDFSYYTEAGVCYTKKMSSELMIGGKLKLLFGSANISNTNKNMYLDANMNEWNIKGSGSVNYTGEQLLNINNYKIPIDANVTAFNFLKPTMGLGAGLDVGLNLKVGYNLVLSASLLDFGFISWFNNVNNINYNVDYKYNGIAKLNIFNFENTLSRGTTIPDSLLNALKSSFLISDSKNGYSTSTKAKLNIGIEYKLYDNQLSLGLLSHSEFFDQSINEEVTASVNAKPTRWLNTSLSYSLINGRLSTFGFGLGLRTGILHWSICTDYIPTQLVKAQIFDDITSLPYNSRRLNFSFGLNIVFNKSAGRFVHNSSGLYGYDVDDE